MPQVESPVQERIVSLPIQKTSTTCPRHRKTTGMFYTPAALSQLLSDWAIRSPNDKVLEPSFGGCVFISSVVDKLSKLLCSVPEKQIYGCDIAEEAFFSLEKLFGKEAPTSQFVKGDFLEVKPSVFGAGVNVVIGNPPYVSRHNMSARQRATVDNFIGEGIVPSPTTASLWAYFIIHSVSFLNDGGRMAFVLPGSLVNSQYGRSILKELPNSFKSVNVILVRQRLFLQEGTDESTIVLLCDGRGIQGGPTQIREVSDLSSLGTILKASLSETESKPIEDRHHRFFEHKLLSQFLKVQSLPVVKTLGDIARISIGVVTGDNQLFVVNKTAAHEAGLSISDFPRILSKFRFARGLCLTKTDIKDLCAIDERCILIRTDRMPKRGALRNYLYRYPRENRMSNKTFAKRTRWFCPGNEEIPDAFFPYMHHAGPQIVFNNAQINCTNTIHRLFFRSEVSEPMRKMAAISLLSSFSQLSAEISGRSYGSGVLKHEPSEAMSIQLLLPSRFDKHALEVAFNQIHNRLKEKKPTEAMLLANQFLGASCGEPKLAEILEALDSVVSSMRKARAPLKSRTH